MTKLSSQHHSFDIHLATEFGIEEAILIHHFQHWVGVNRRLKRNFINGRTWTYQTREEIAAHFPYLNERKVKYALSNLIKKGILKRGNYNKKGFDKTGWYAFVNEEKFTSDKNGHPADKIVTPIPDTKPYPSDSPTRGNEISQASANHDEEISNEEAVQSKNLLVKHSKMLRLTESEPYEIATEYRFFEIEIAINRLKANFASKWRPKNPKSAYFASLKKIRKICALRNYEGTLCAYLSERGYHNVLATKNE